MLAWLDVLMIVAAAPSATPSATAPPASATCSVTVDGLPAPSRRSHTLEVIGQPAKPADGLVPVAFVADRVTVKLYGPRFRGAILVRRSECKPGVVLHLQAVPLPAILEFACGPKNLVVRCLDCPADIGSNWFVHRGFPPIDVTSLETVYRFEYKASGYRTANRRERIFPGVNQISVDLEPLG